MGLLSGAAIFFIVWWLVLFTVLPWGADSAHETESAVEPGTAPSAPMAPRIARKFVITTIVASVIFAAIYVAVSNELFGLDDVPFLPTFSH